MCKSSLVFSLAFFINFHLSQIQKKMCRLATFSLTCFILEFDRKKGRLKLQNTFSPTELVSSPTHREDGVSDLANHHHFSALNRAIFLPTTRIKLLIFG
jgi:hypothetical protein